MRTSALALAALIFALTAARTTLGQLPAGAKIQGNYSASSPKKPQPTPGQEQAASEMQYAFGEMPADANGNSNRQPVQIVMYVPEPMPGAVQPAGFHHHHAAAAQCYPGGPYGHGGHYGHPGHHGHHGHGGRYGYFGGAHHTPGYPHLHHHGHREYVGPQGPPTAAVAYPYYTVRGPRDFLIDNPPSIGR